MQLDLNDLPSDTALLHRLVRDMASLVEQHESEIDRLQLIIKQLQRARFGRRSERTRRRFAATATAAFLVRGGP
jgi:transposase